MSWLQLKMVVAGEFADELSDYCLELGAVSAVLDNAGADSLAEAVLEPAPGVTIVWERAVITAFWSAGEDLQSIFDRLRSKIHDKSIFAEVAVEFIADGDFSSPPPQQVAELCFGAGTLWLVPRDVSRERLSELTESAVIKLDPGLAFGSGLHPTTQLCLDYLARLPSLADCEVLDFGCGSGVLALGALALGALSADGVDHDPQALVATLDNAAYNDLGEGMQVFQPSQLPIDAHYEVVVANILANPLIELATEISARVRPGGQLVLAGLLVEQAVAVQAAYPAIKFDRPTTYQGSAIAAVAETGAGGVVANSDEDWVCLHGVKMT